MQEQVLACRHQHCMRMEMIHCVSGSVIGMQNPGHRDSMFYLSLGISKLPFSKLQPCRCSS